MNKPLIADIFNGLNTIVVTIDKRRSPVHLVACSFIRPASISANLVHLSLSDAIVVKDPLLNVLLLCKVHPRYVQDWLTSDNRLWLLHLDQVFLFVEFIRSHAIHASCSLFTIYEICFIRLICTWAILLDDIQQLEAVQFFDRHRRLLGRGGTPRSRTFDWKSFFWSSRAHSF